MSEIYKFGIGFWIGWGIYSIINMILNINNVAQSKVLNYNYIITGAAILGLILNVALLKINAKLAASFIEESSGSGQILFPSG